MEKDGVVRWRRQDFQRRQILANRAFMHLDPEGLGNPVLQGVDRTRAAETGGLDRQTLR